jgi:hypothetical protein
MAWIVPAVVLTWSSLETRSTFEWLSGEACRRTPQGDEVCVRDVTDARLHAYRTMAARRPRPPEDASTIDPSTRCALDVTESLDSDQPARILHSCTPVQSSLMGISRVVKESRRIYQREMFGIVSK